MVQTNELIELQEVQLCDATEVEQNYRSRKYKIF